MIVSNSKANFKDLYFFFLLGGLLLLIPFSWECEPVISFEVKKIPELSENLEGKLHYPHFGNVFFTEEPVSSYSPISKELLLTSYVGRPDSHLKYDFFLELAASKEGRKGRFGEKIYLKQEKGSLLSFSEEPTSIYVKARDDVSRICLDLQEKEQEHKNWLVFPKSYSAIPSTDPILKKLSQLRFLGRDLLALKKNQKISVVEWEGKPLFMQEGCFWVLDNLKFREKQAQEDTSSFYLIRAFLKEDKKMQIQLWDLEGNASIITVPQSTSSPIKVPLSEIDANITPRTLKKITFFCGKTPLLLNQLEAVQKTKKGWQKFSYAGEGDVFLFHHIEHAKGKSVVFGQIFNDTRTLSQKVELPLLPKAVNDKTCRKGVYSK